MKIIDLLNKIANGEETPNFEYYGGIYKYDKRTGNYWCNDMWFDFSAFKHLNDEVEILEGEKKIPEKIEEKEIEISMAIGEQVCANKINEIIDYLKSKGE